MCEDIPKGSLLFCDGNAGVYVPQRFATEVNPECLSGVERADMDILAAGPDHAMYWDAWDNVERDAVVTEPDGRVFHLYQDQDLWLCPVE